MQLFDFSRTCKVTDDDLAWMNIGENFWRVTLDAIPDCGFKKVYAQWVKRLDECMKKGYGLYIWGDFRRGKSAAATLMMREVASHMGTAYFLETGRIADFWIGNVPFDDEMLIKERVFDVDLLVLDDVGANHNDFVAGIIEQIFRFRADRAMPTVCTANPHPSKLAKHGTSFIKVLKNYCWPARLEGRDWGEEASEEMRGLFEGGDE